MRGGSSRGPFFQLKDLPADRDKLSEVLIAAVGSGHPLNIDGIGGGNSVTTKVAIVSPSSDDWDEVDAPSMLLLADPNVWELEVASDARVKGKNIL